jgi:hypothetical protein
MDYSRWITNQRIRLDLGGLFLQNRHRSGIDRFQPSDLKWMVQIRWEDRERRRSAGTVADTAATRRRNSETGQTTSNRAARDTEGSRRARGDLPARKTDAKVTSRAPATAMADGGAVQIADDELVNEKEN